MNNERFGFVNICLNRIENGIELEDTHITKALKDLNNAFNKIKNEQAKAINKKQKDFNVNNSHPDMSRGV